MKVKWIKDANTLLTLAKNVRNCFISKYSNLLPHTDGSVTIYSPAGDVSCHNIAIMDGGKVRI